MRFYFNVLLMLAVSGGLFGCSDESSNRISIEGAIDLPFPAELDETAFRDHGTYIDRLKPRGQLLAEAAEPQNIILSPRLENGETLWLPTAVDISLINTFLENYPKGSLEIYWCYELPGNELNEKFDPDKPDAMRCAENEVALGTTDYPYDKQSDNQEDDPAQFTPQDSNDNGINDIGEFNSGILNPSLSVTIEGDVSAKNLIIVPPVVPPDSACPDMNGPDSFEPNQWGVSEALLLPPGFEATENTEGTEITPRSWSILYVPANGNVCVGFPVQALPPGSELPAVAVQTPDQEEVELTENMPITISGERPSSLQLKQGEKSITMNLLYQTESSTDSP